MGRRFTSHDIAPDTFTDLRKWGMMMERSLEVTGMGSRYLGGAKRLLQFSASVGPVAADTKGLALPEISYEEQWLPVLAAPDQAICFRVRVRVFSGRRMVVHCPATRYAPGLRRRPGMLPCGPHRLPISGASSRPTESHKTEASRLSDRGPRRQGMSALPPRPVRPPLTPTAPVTPDGRSLQRFAPPSSFIAAELRSWGLVMRGTLELTGMGARYLGGGKKLL